MDIFFLEKRKFSSLVLFYSIGKFKRFLYFCVFFFCPFLFHGKIQMFFVFSCIFLFDCGTRFLAVPVDFAFILRENYFSIFLMCFFFNWICIIGSYSKWIPSFHSFPFSLPSRKFYWFSMCFLLGCIIWTGSKWVHSFSRKFQCSQFLQLYYTGFFSLYSIDFFLKFQYF